VTSNFEFLQTEFADLHEDAVQSEANALSAPRTCAFYARRTLERMVKWMYAHDSYLRTPYQDNLAALIHEPTFKDTLAPGLFNQVRMIHKLGNLAVHSDTKINAADGLQVTRCLHTVVGWLAKSYSKSQPTIAAFDEPLLPRPVEAEVADRNAEQLATLQEKLQGRDETFEQPHGHHRGKGQSPDHRPLLSRGSRPPRAVSR
jgi:type I restriction enzyme R subunit